VLILRESSVHTVKFALNNDKLLEFLEALCNRGKPQGYQNSMTQYNGLNLHMYHTGRINPSLN